MNSTVKIIDLSNGSPEAVAKKIIEALESKLAGNVRLLHIADKTIIADYFVLANGNSTTQVRALAGEVEFIMTECALPPRHAEGMSEGSWTALDFSSVIVHIFNPEQREFYNLDKLWGDASEINIAEFLK